MLRRPARRRGSCPGTHSDDDTPETLRRVVDFFRRAQSDHGRCASFGIAAFGPLDLALGRITNTPKPGWSGVDLVSPFREAFNSPVAIDTDVNGAGIAEALFGAGRNRLSLVYITAGTGIGGGTIADGVPQHNSSHPEMGHIRVPRHRDDLSFAGICPFHGDCLEGLASGPAVMARWGKCAESLRDDAAVWDVMGFYIAHLVHSVTMLIAPEVIIIGGGLADCEALFPCVRQWTKHLLGGYPKTQDLERYIVGPTLGSRAGITGALVLAQRLTARRRAGGGDDDDTVK